MEAALTPEEFYLKGSNTGLFLSFDPEDETVKLSERSSVKDKLDGQIWTRSSPGMMCRSGKVLEGRPEVGAPVVAAMPRDEEKNQHFGTIGMREAGGYKYDINAMYDVSGEKEEDVQKICFITFMDNDEKPTMQNLKSRRGGHEVSFEMIKGEEKEENVSEEVLEEAFKLFTDGNDEITSAKLREVAKKTGGYMTQEGADALIRKADKDGDNVIDKSEFKKLYSAILALEGREEVKRMRAGFKEMDPEESGYITKEGMMKIAMEDGNMTGEDAAAQAKMIIDSLDIDKDGRVSSSEFLMSMMLKCYI